MPCDDCSRAETCPPCVNEPQGICRCGHGAAYHDAKYGDPQCRLCPEDGERMWRHTFVPADAETAEESEAPEEPTLASALKRVEALEHEKSRRPPYAVAYAVEGGTEYEVALPGDATVRAVDGALLVTHSRPVLALTIVRPMGAEET